MKKLLILAALTLALTACNADIPVTPMSEALKISAYTYPASTAPTADPPDQSLVALTRLDKETEYLLPKVGFYKKLNNINLLLEYDGRIEIISETKDSQLSVDEKQAIWDYSGFEGRHFGYDLTINNSGWVAVLPLGFCSGPHEIDSISIDPFEGFESDSTESILTINALDGTDRVMITAKLTIRSVAHNLCAVELISYDYSDAYKLMESANN